MDKTKLKKFALGHPILLKLYRATLGKLKTVLYWGLQKKFLQKNGINIIQNIFDELEKEGARVFIDFGTLLGIIRDQKLIEHDRDIDFGIYFDEQFSPEDLDRVMSKLGFKRYKYFSYNGETMEITYVNGVIHVDFFRHQEEAEGSINYSFYRNPNYNYPSNAHYTPFRVRHANIPGLKKMQMGGLTVNIPVNEFEYLESIYTKNWRIPDPHWTHLRTPGLVELKEEYGIMHNKL